MSIRPSEYKVVAFPGRTCDGAIAPALADLITSRTVLLVDALRACGADLVEGARIPRELSDVEAAR